MVSIEDLFQAIPPTRGLPIRLSETLPPLDPPRPADLRCFPEARAKVRSVIAAFHPRWAFEPPEDS